MEFEKGCVVKSAAGRDKGRMLLVFGTEQNRVLICDGKERPLQRPKQKNPRHLILTGIRLNDEDTVTNRALKKALRQFNSGCGGITKEGKHV